MTILAHAPTGAERPPLPPRPQPHERDGRQPVPSDGRPHPQQATADSVSVAFLDKALARVVEQQLGPRRAGAIYQNSNGAVFEVLAVVTKPAMAQEMLTRRCARFAVVVRDVMRADAQPFVVGSPWTDSDWLVRAGHGAPAQKREQAA
jgi:hypothetical protein